MVTREAPTASPSSVPALTPQLEPSGAWSVCTHQPPQAQCGAQTVPFSTFLAPNSLLCPSLTARGCFSLDPGQLQNQGCCSISLQGVFTSLNAFPSVLGVTPFLSGAPRTWKRDEKGRQSAGCSKAKDVEIFKEDIEGGTEKAALSAPKGAKGWEAAEEKLGKLQRIGNIRARTRATSAPWLCHG